MLNTGLRALVTGAAGFVGANLVRRLLDGKNHVELFLRPEARPWRLAGIEDQLNVHRLDIQDTEAVIEAARRAQPEVIFHLAVYGAYSFQTDRVRMVRSNVLGTANVIEGALATGCPVMVNTGSSSEYGDCDHAPAEDEPARPNSDYAITKVAATELCRRVSATSDLKVTTLRLYSVYGPWEEPARLIPQLLVNALQHRWPPLGPPWIVRDFVHVDDVVDAYLLAASARGQERGPIYNVGSGRQTSLEDLTEVARRAFAIPEPPTWASYEARAWDVRTWVANPAKIKSELGWHPQIPLESGLRQTAEWLDPHLQRYRLKPAHGYDR